MKLFGRLLILTLPLILSIAFTNLPQVSYLIAWGGSVAIFWLSVSGWIKPLPKDLPIDKQLMRPIFFPQFLFVGYMAFSSIFFFLNAKGFTFFDFNLFDKAGQDVFLQIAQAQRYYLLAHLGLVAGILAFMDYPVKTNYRINMPNKAGFFVLLAFLFLAAKIIFSQVGGLSQFADTFSNISLIAMVLSVYFSIIEKRKLLLFLTIVIFSANLGYSFFTGWKENSLVLLLLLICFLYPIYKKKMLFIGGAVIFIWLMFVPYYNNAFRQYGWFGESSSQQAFSQAYEDVKNAGKDSLKDSNWAFLTYRFSEISLFMKYIENIPANRPYYGLENIRQSFMLLPPRILWPAKPDLEKTAMERVYENGVANRLSIISAKPHLVIDSYISGGWLAILLVFLVFGSISSILSRWCEYLFGGYYFGTVLVYNSVFQIFWKGSCFEFIINATVWGAATVILLFWAGRIFNLIVSVKTHEN